MECGGSISKWLGGVTAGDFASAQQVWNRYFDKLVRLAQTNLRTSKCRVADEEDVALSALHSFLAGAAAGKFPKLEDRDDLWRILVTITERKAWRQVDRERMAKRGGGNVRGESIFHKSDGSETLFGMELQPGVEPTPEFVVEMAEQVDVLLTALGSDLLRRVAILKMQGYAVEEIAREIGSSTRSVKRKLGLIREIWSADLINENL